MVKETRQSGAYLYLTPYMIHVRSARLDLPLFHSKHSSASVFHDPVKSNCMFKSNTKIQNGQFAVRVGISGSVEGRRV